MFLHTVCKKEAKFLVGWGGGGGLKSALIIIGLYSQLCHGVPHAPMKCIFLNT
jgi:hypothetical protein